MEVDAAITNAPGALISTQVGGPFVMTSSTEIARAYEDFLHGRFNATGGRPEAYASDSDSSAVE